MERRMARDAARQFFMAGPDPVRRSRQSRQQDPAESCSNPSDQHRPNTRSSSTLSVCAMNRRTSYDTMLEFCHPDRSQQIPPAMDSMTMQSPSRNYRGPITRSITRDMSLFSCVGIPVGPQERTMGSSSNYGVDTSGPVQTVPDRRILSSMSQIIFVDLDNWAGFFEHLPHPLPPQHFVWGFYGGKQHWKPPGPSCKAYQECYQQGNFYRHAQCGRWKDAADCAIIINLAQQDERLSTDISFCVISGDHIFREAESHIQSNRRINIIDPHHLSELELFEQIVNLSMPCAESPLEKKGRIRKSNKVKRLKHTASSLTRTQPL